ncbi:MAG TPA: SGNH/GDSL hydrolase family protein [Mucilaginibacter sp.]|jgi:lysophospholipase L1-like esterase|nr:SGNH/GDSL hydrolase family protein [Mucilaginibacter sp.]
MSPNNNRRSFIKTASISTIAAISIPQIVSSALAAAPKGKKIAIQKGDTILFQGDSITDAGRGNRNAIVPNNAGALGTGYALMTTGELLLQNPEKDLKIYNKGVSGNKVYQLADRWDADTLAIKPNILSIHIGVNDFWHTLTNGYTGTIDNYIADYKKLLDRTKQALPDVKLIICEPYAVKGVKAVDDKWYPTFDLFRKAALDMATQYNAPFVPFQAIYDKAITMAPPAYWTADGVHPSVAGAALMSRAWLETVKG